MSLSTLPRKLYISTTTPIAKHHILALYKHQLKVAQSFASYNFREYFVRRTKYKFKSELPALLDPSYSSPISTTSSTPDKINTTPPPSGEETQSIYAPTSTPSAADTSATTTSGSGETTPELRLREWYTATVEDLVVMSRAALVNRMYEGPKLVVEMQKGIITGGGGAGAEASYAGGGQPAIGTEGTKERRDLF